MRPAHLLAAPLVAVLALLLPATAHADPTDGPVGLSTDGQGYADSLEGPLFASSLRWVPGDRRSTSWWVRNEAPDVARLAVEVPEDAVLPPWLTVEARTGSTWTPVAAGSALDAGLLDPGAATRVDLRVGMRPGAGNPTRRESADLRLRVRLTEDDRGLAPGGEAPGGDGPGGGGPGEDGAGEDGAGEGGADDGAGGGLLPGTGSTLGLLSLLLGLLMVGVGVALLRRRDEDPHPEHDHDRPASDRERQEVAP